MTEFSPSNHREQAARFFRVAGIDGRDFFNRSSPVLDELESLKAPILGIVLNRMLDRFDGALFSAPGLQALSNLSRKLGYDSEALQEEVARNFCSPLQLSDDRIENSRAGIQQFFRIWAQQAMDLRYSPGADGRHIFGRTDLETIIRYYESSAKLAGDSSGLALKAVMFDVVFAKKENQLRSALIEDGFYQTQIFIRGQSWPCGRPPDWPYKSEYDRKAFLFELILTLKPEQAPFWADETRVGIERLSQLVNRTSCELAESLSELYQVRGSSSTESTREIDSTQIRFKVRIPYEIPS